MAQSVECLLCKQEELSPTSGTYVKSLTAHICNTRPGEVEAEDPWGSLASQRSQAGRLQVSQHSMEGDRIRLEINS